MHAVFLLFSFLFSEWNGKKITLLKNHLSHYHNGGNYSVAAGVDDTEEGEESYFETIDDDDEFERVSEYIENLDTEDEDEE